MPEEPEAQKPLSPGILAGPIVGAISAWLAATYFGHYSSPFMAIFLGAVGGLLGNYLRHSFREAFAAAIVALVLVLLGLKMLPEAWLIKTALVPLAIGFATGEITGGVWREMSGGPRPT